jgi:hypothetical protein
MRRRAQAEDRHGRSSPYPPLRGVRPKPTTGVPKYRGALQTGRDGNASRPSGLRVLARETTGCRRHEKTEGNQVHARAAAITPTMAERADDTTDTAGPPRKNRRPTRSALAREASRNWKGEAETTYPQPCGKTR